MKRRTRNLMIGAAAALAAAGALAVILSAKPPPVRVCTERTRAACRFVVYLKSGRLYRYEGLTSAAHCINHVKAYELIFGRLFHAVCIEEEARSGGL